MVVHSLTSPEPVTMMLQLYGWWSSLCCNREKTPDGIWQMQMQPAEPRSAGHAPTLRPQALSDPQAMHLHSTSLI